MTGLFVAFMHISVAEKKQKQLNKNQHALKEGKTVIPSPGQTPRGIYFWQNTTVKDKRKSGK